MFADPVPLEPYRKRRALRAAAAYSLALLSFAALLEYLVARLDRKDPDRERTAD
jgi:hypothetical protein